MSRGAKSGPPPEPLPKVPLDRLARVLVDQDTVDGSAVPNSQRDEQPPPEPDEHGGFLPVAPMATREVMSYPTSASDMPSSNGG